VRLVGLTVRAFRNLEDQTLEFPPGGVVLVGPNGQGKTSLLEAIGYPVLMRSFRTTRDQELARFGEPGFHTGLQFERAGRPRTIAATVRPAERRKQLELDGESVARIVAVAGQWQAVVFAPDDVRLASGPAAGRRLFLDRTLALADAGYLSALLRYRSALRQRNAALRQGRFDVARAFEPPLAESGALIVARRRNWIAAMNPRFGALLAELGEPASDVSLAYHGDVELTDPAAWTSRLREAAPRDQARRLTTVGPHRDDLIIRLAGRGLRWFGSTGQHRSTAIGLKLLELETIREAAGSWPALLLDDVFAELDATRQGRLAGALFRDRSAQVFLTSPRLEELPGDLGLPVWRVQAGRVHPDRVGQGVSHGSE
jgi:DNA replication and repair protein RecF